MEAASRQTHTALDAPVRERETAGLLFGGLPAEAAMPEVLLKGGELIRIDGLNSTPQYNGYCGRVCGMRDNGRVVVDLVATGEKKQLALQPKNIKMIDPDARAKVNDATRALIETVGSGPHSRTEAVQQALGSVSKLLALTGDAIADGATRSALGTRVETLERQAADGKMSPQWPAEMATELSILFESVNARAAQAGELSAEQWQTTNRCADGLEMLVGELAGVPVPAPAAAAAPTASVPAPEVSPPTAPEGGIEEIIADLEAQKAAALAT